MPGGSSTTSSQTHFTPSETILSPTATMVDVSQQAREELGTSNPPLSGLALSDEVWTMDLDLDPNLDPNPMLDMPLSFEQRSAGEGLDQHLGNQDQWAVYDHGETNIQYAGSSRPQPMRSAHLGLDDTDVPPDLQVIFAALDQVFPAGQQSLPTAQSNDTPRFIPWPTEAIAAAARPWSPEVLNSGQLERNPGAQELLYEPAWDSRLRHPANHSDERLFPGGKCVDELDQGDLSGSGVHLVNGCLPDENIDPPPSPDPVGPPSQIADRNSGLSRKTPKARKAGGRRHQPLNPHSRHNAKRRRAQGQCWSCTLQRNPV
ncbi:MAG: hypothetical protein Q9221_000969 [Calogaya cf. arnoldii]